jgi:hypothetical protein
MAENRRPGKRVRIGKRRLTRVAQALVFALSTLLAQPSYADLRPRARPRIAPPMRFVRVTSAEAACKPNCPEWMSAEGRIDLGTAKAFADAIANLKGRRLPILIHSPGGSVADAGTMGELIRAKGLVVAVARTLIPNCPEASPKCPDGPGTAITGGAICASACVLVLAGGVERLAAPSARIGVHQTTTEVRETEGLAHLKSTRKIYEQQGVDAAVQAYLAATGVGEPVMTLMRKTSAASIRWLSPAELKDSHLATLALDAAEPILASGANGLNGHAFDGDPPRSDLVQASVVRTVAGGGAAVEVTFRYRPGGGAVELEAIDRGLDSPQAPDRSSSDSRVSAAGVGPLQLKTTSATPVRTLIPRERFCALAHGRLTIASTPPERPQAFAPIDLATLNGAKMLFAEACP